MGSDKNEGKSEETKFWTERLSRQKEIQNNISVLNFQAGGGDSGELMEFKAKPKTSEDKADLDTKDKADLDTNQDISEVEKENSISQQGEITGKGIFKRASELFGWESDICKELREGIEAVKVTAKGQSDGVAAGYDPSHWATDKELTDCLLERLRGKAHVIAAGLAANLLNQKDQKAQRVAIGRLTQTIADLKHKEKDEIPIVIPINTSNEGTDYGKTDAGSHWISCVILPPKDKDGENKYEVYLLDSKGSNHTLPEKFKEALTGMLGQTLCLEGESRIQQKNDHDCGWWVVHNSLRVVEEGNAKFIVSELATGNQIRSEELRAMYPMGPQPDQAEGKSLLIAKTDKKPSSPALVAQKRINELEEKLKAIQNTWTKGEDIDPIAMKDAIEQSKEQIQKIGLPADRQNAIDKQLDALKNVVDKQITLLDQRTLAHVTLNRSLITEAKIKQSAEIMRRDYKLRVEAEIEKENEEIKIDTAWRIIEWGTVTPAKEDLLTIHREKDTYSIEGIPGQSFKLGYIRYMVIELLERSQNHMPIKLECESAHPNSTDAEKKAYADRMMKQIKAAIEAAEKYSSKAHVTDEKGNKTEPGANLSLGENAKELLELYRKTNPKEAKRLEERIDRLKEKWDVAIGQKHREEVVEATGQTSVPRTEASSADPKLADLGGSLPSADIPPASRDSMSASPRRTTT